jgi:DnaJ-class molecular chaperone
MADPYETLGVTREATQDEIRKAYRRLAKQNHTDLNPGDKGAEARFKEIASAYDIVGDEKKRARFDAGEIDASGAERQQQPEREYYRQHAEAGPGFKYERRWESMGPDDQEDLFAEIFGRRGASAGMKAKGPDIGYTMSVDFAEAVNGAKKRVVMADGKALDITIPAGLKDGQTLRLRGQGQPGFGGGAPGDAMVEIHVKPHPSFRREGNNIHSILPVTVGEALGGAKVRVETVSGAVEVTVPKGSNTGRILRLRRKGVPSASGNGDQLVELRVVLPDHPDDELVRSVTEWEAKHPYDPRKSQGAKP